MKENFKRVLFPFFALVLFFGIGGFVYWDYTRPKVVVPVIPPPTYVTSYTHDCPADYPIKANLHSMIYHMPYDQYYSETNAQNCLCFDNATDAEAHGFRASMR